MFLKMARGAVVLLIVTAAAFCASIYNYTLKTIDGQPMPLADLKGKVVLLVNVASRCGYTPQYTGLESLYMKHKDQGFVIVGIPANNFGSQEPGTNAEIKTFCKSKYDVTFPMAAKVSVKAPDQAPLYQYLTDKENNPTIGGDIKWNFTKFLVSRDGKILARFEPAVTLDDPALNAAVDKALQ